MTESAAEFVRREEPAHTTRGEAQRRALRLAAFELIAEGGFERLRTRDVAERAGVNIATLHYYFKTKEDLIRGVVNDLRRTFAAANPRRVPAPEGGPLDRLRRELASDIEQARAIPGAYVVLYELFLRSLRDPAIQAIMLGLDEGWQRQYEALLAAGVRQGAFRADLDVAATAAAIIAAIKGAILQSMFHPDGPSLERVLAQLDQWLTVSLPNPSAA